MKALILVGGRGTRLREVVNVLPKPMAPVAGKPFLEYLIIHLKQYGLRNIVLCVGYRGTQIREHFKDGRKWDVKILYSQEEVPLGTGGAVKLVENLIEEENFLVVNGDSFLDVNPNMLMNHHLSQRALLTMAMVEMNDKVRYGAITVNGQGAIVNFAEKEEMPGSKLINGGVYVFNREIFDHIPEGKVSLENDIFPSLIGKGFYGMTVRGFFIDIGLPEDYRKLQEKPQAFIRLTKNGEI